MNKYEELMKHETMLPEDFDGVFLFTNFSEEDFIGVWNKKEYVFPAMSRSPMIIPEHSPIEVQQIRKKFAKDLAEREFTKGDQYGRFMAQERTPEGTAKLNSIHQAAGYTLDHLAPLIQKCLQPLEIKKATVRKVLEKPFEEKLSRNDDGELNTAPVRQNQSLVEQAKKGKGLPEQS